MLSKTILSIALSAILLTSCDDLVPEAPNPYNPTETITLVRYTLSPQTGGDPIVLEIGDDKIAPGSAELKTNTKYDGKLEFFDTNTETWTDVTSEIIEEGTAHQIFYQTSSTLNVSIFATDMDKTGNPLGLQNRFEANTPTNGSLKVILKHKPEKSLEDVQQGIMTNAGGETDIEVNFGIRVTR